MPYESILNPSASTSAAGRGHRPTKRRHTTHIIYIYIYIYMYGYI